MAQHVIEVDHRIVGDGVVAYWVLGYICADGMGCTSSKDLLIFACKSGQTLRIDVSLNREFDGKKYDLSSQAFELMRTVSDLDEAHSMAEVKVMFEGAGFSVDDLVQDEENCACAATFPDLVNGKKKFEGL